MSIGPEPVAVGERPIAPVRGTRDWLPGDFLRLAGLERLLLERFARAGYAPMRTPVLEPTELHERKSGAAIVSKLYELADGHPGAVCLRPELTAGIVRAYTDAPEAPGLPWRVGHAGPVFRREKDPSPGRWREFHQAGVELIGASGPAADGEVISLADWALAEAGVQNARIRLGHVGLILEMLRRSGLPGPAQTALVETLGAASADGGDISALEVALDGLSDWLASADSADEPPEVVQGDGAAVDRLFRTLVPVVNGRRDSREIVGRLRRKWDLGRSLRGVLDHVRDQVRALAALKGPPAAVLDRLGRDFEALAPESVAELRALIATLDSYGIDPARIELDFGFGRGIGFYSQVIFAIVATTPEGPLEICGGGRYDGLARVLGSDRDDHGVGFAIGLERLLQALPGATADPAPSGYLVVRGRGGEREAARLTTTLRALGDRAVLDFGQPEADSLARARALGLAKVVCWADGSAMPRALLIRDVVTGAEVEVSLRELEGPTRGEGRRR